MGGLNQWAFYLDPIKPAYWAKDSIGLQMFVQSCIIVPC